MTYVIALVKALFSTNIFLFLDENICCRGASNEYPQHMFLSQNKKNIETSWLKKAPYQELWHMLKL